MAEDPLLRYLRDSKQLNDETYFSWFPASKNPTNPMVVDSENMEPPSPAPKSRKSLQNVSDESPETVLHPGTSKVPLPPGDDEEMMDSELPPPPFRTLPPPIPNPPSPEPVVTEEDPSGKNFSAFTDLLLENRDLKDNIRAKDATISSLMAEIQRLLEKVQLWERASEIYETQLTNPPPPGEPKIPPRNRKRTRVISPIHPLDSQVPSFHSISIHRPDHSSDPDIVNPPKPHHDKELWSTVVKKNRPNNHQRFLMEQQLSTKGRKPAASPPKNSPPQSAALQPPLLFTNVVPKGTPNCRIGSIRKLLAKSGLNMTIILDISWLKRGILAVRSCEEHRQTLASFLMEALNWKQWTPKSPIASQPYSPIMSNKRENDWAFYMFKDLLFYIGIVAGDLPENKLWILDFVGATSPLTREALEATFLRASRYVKSKLHEPMETDPVERPEPAEDLSMVKLPTVEPSSSC
jgi:hypothetical protein